MTEPPREPVSPPPDPGYPPPWMYPPPGVYPPPSGYYPGYSGYPSPAPRGYANMDEKTWALIAHFGGAAGVFLGGWLGFVGPLVALLAKGDKSPTVRAHSVEALNFQLTWAGAAFALTFVLCCASVVTFGLASVGFILLAAPWLVATIFSVVAGVKANEGELFRYPMSIRIVR